MKPIKKEPILPENKIHKCPYNCGLGFLVYNSLINHISNDHLENLGANENQNANYLEDNPYKSNYLEENPCKSNYLEENPYKCFKCDERFSDRRKAMQHSAKHSEKSHVDIEL